MDIYHIWCDLKPGTSDLEFTDAANAYLRHLQKEGNLAAYRITRRKLGLGADGLGEFHLMLEFESLAKLDETFLQVATRNNPVESFHFAVNQKVANVKFALYRDFPDEFRQTGEEQF
ncbi:MAG: hypothetical protein JJ921_03920 [Pseudomonadales bacterium]|nr:hypothetical protein [Pseudomonadales bacterium]MBO7007835.1 hypothetical protein [Pseudomonadales bacterium]